MRDRRVPDLDIEALMKGSALGSQGVSVKNREFGEARKVGFLGDSETLSMVEKELT